MESESPSWSEMMRLRFCVGSSRLFFANAGGPVRRAGYCYHLTITLVYGLLYFSDAQLISLDIAGRCWTWFVGAARDSAKP